MKIARRDFFPLYMVFASSYLFSRIFIQEPLLVNSAWISMICAFAAALPALLCALPLMGAGQPLDEVFSTAYGRVGAKIWYALFGVLLLVVLKNAVELYVDSVMAYADNLVIDFSVIIAVVLIGGLGAYIGQMAISGCSHITLWLLIIILGALTLASLSWVEPEYFFPLLGPGIEKIAQSIIPLSGALIIPMLFLFGADTCDKGMRRMLLISAAAGAIATALSMATYTMSMPTLPDMPISMSFRTGMMLFNCNSGIQLQFPLIVLWNACQLLLISSMISLCSGMLRLIFPRLGRNSVPVITCAVLLICLLLGNENWYRLAVDYAAYPLITLGFAVTAILYPLRSRSLKRSRRR